MWRCGFRIQAREDRGECGLGPRSLREPLVKADGVSRERIETGRFDAGLVRVHPEIVRAKGVGDHKDDVGSGGLLLWIEGDAPGRRRVQDRVAGARGDGQGIEQHAHTSGLAAAPRERGGNEPTHDGNEHACTHGDSAQCEHLLHGGRVPRQDVAQKPPHADDAPA